MAADRLKAALEAFVRQATARTDYLGIFGARVLSQNADGTLELKPDDARLPGLSRVPFRYGVPGVTATVAAGTRVGVEFEAGNPARPVVTLWELGSVTKLEVDASSIVFNGGSTPVAKEGSATTGHVHSVVGTAGPYPIILTTPGVTGSATDTIATGAGSSSIKVP